MEAPELAVPRARLSAACRDGATKCQRPGSAVTQCKQKSRSVAASPARVRWGKSTGDEDQHDGERRPGGDVDQRRAMPHIGRRRYSALGRWRNTVKTQRSRPGTQIVWAPPARAAATASATASGVVAIGAGSSPAVIRV
jgi:hypothetical protein